MQEVKTCADLIFFEVDLQKKNLFFFRSTKSISRALPEKMLRKESEKGSFLRQFVEGFDQNLAIFLPTQSLCLLASKALEKLYGWSAERMSCNSTKWDTLLVVKGWNPPRKGKGLHLPFSAPAH